MTLAPSPKGAFVLKGFKDFLMRGNVVELAVAVIIGTAFTAVVTSIADNLIKPIIAAFGGTNISGLAWTIIDGNQASTIDFAAILTAIIAFLITASVVYFMFVLPIKTIQERRKRGEEPGPAEPTDVEVLLEIRDLLRQQQNGQAQQPTMQTSAPYQGQYPPGPPAPGAPGHGGRPGPAGPAQGPGGPTGHGGPPPGSPGPRNW
jgi:large conductance mechanosensitive channel